MLWRPRRLAIRPSLFGITKPCALGLFVRRLSGISTSNLSIATILATPPAGADAAATITAVGSVRTVRSQKQFAFVELGDGSTTHSLQALLKPSQAEGLSTGTTLAIRGRWQPAPKGKEQNYELKAEDVRMIGPADAEVSHVGAARGLVDFTASHEALQADCAEYLRTLPHLRLRTPNNALLARMRSESDFHLANFFRDHGFLRLQPPIITSSDCEGAGEVFTVSSNTSATSTDGKDGTDQAVQPFFKAPKFLTVSSQLHLEAFVHEHQKVWTLSPTFRAEKSDTPRHVSEFWMLEAEVRTETLHDVISLVEDTIRALVRGLQGSALMEELTHANRKAEVGEGETARLPELLRERWKGLLQQPWPRITYQEAIDFLQNAAITFQYEPSWERGLQLEHERYIAAHFGHGRPVCVTNFPLEIKPFYMLPSTSENSGYTGERKTAACFDLLLPDVCEVVGGSLREHRLDELLRSMRDHGLNLPIHNAAKTGDFSGSPSSAGPGNLDWYVDLRRYGSVPHGGFGLGFDRLLSYLTGINNIKDVVPWPRYHNRCDC